MKLETIENVQLHVLLMCLCSIVDTEAVFCSLQVEYLVCVLREKGPDSGRRLLRALKASLQDEDHPGHRHLVQRLEEEMRRATARQGQGGERERGGG